ncbi:MAG: hypothetical protein KGK01_14775 [Bradyrhizobium sp.]|uniref:hypothetical protein n=1 Tax=Bradyrhizobium sp. TaxID=376 RepID=UPI00239136BF|nr:hypothetical protein [Bradyrhizobium sp.]MDE2066279.1 hypothetical protein [Bradyrhizobium sp.]MDE2243641.1 hypothetical protein [Bradyrhizobium sp.]
MHGSFDRSQEQHDNVDRDWSVVLFALPVLVVIALVALAIIQPSAPSWISEAAQAEFVGIDSPDTAFAQPAMQIRTVKAE